MSVEVKIGDVFYKIEPTDHKVYHRKCRVCEGSTNLTINDITFKCPMCSKEGEALRVNGYCVRRYRVYAIENYIDTTDWKYDGGTPSVRYKLYHKSGKGNYCAIRNEVTLYDSDFSGRLNHFNDPNPDDNMYCLNRCIYSDYNLAVAVANRLTEKQVEIVRAYNEQNNTDYPLPVFLIEHDKKSK